MTERVGELKLALEDFVAASSSREQERIRAALGRVLDCEQQLDADADTDPQLRHYLQRRSYLKALAYLQGGDPEQGNCGGK